MNPIFQEESAYENIIKGLKRSGYVVKFSMDGISISPYNTVLHFGPLQITERKRADVPESGISVVYNMTGERETRRIYLTEFDEHLVEDILRDRPKILDIIDYGARKMSVLIREGTKPVARYIYPQSY